MGLLSHFKRKSEPSAGAHNSAPPAEPDAVAAARTRARRRLIGATVLLGIGVIGFPLLFETQPRPISVNIPIEIPRKDSAAPLQLPPAAPLSAASAVLLDETPVGAPGRPDPATAEIVERAAEQGREVPARAALVPAAPVVRPGPPAETVPAPAKAAAPVAVVAPSAAVAKPPAAAAAKPDDGARARALLNGNSNILAAASAPAARVVVQVGAYAEASKLAEARKKLEALGIKTYTQVVEVDGAKRTRVRVGPFASRADADKVAARVKSAGLPVAILTL